jgi:hypothetical protein
MPRNRKKKDEDLLTRLVSAAEKDVLAGLVLAFAGEKPEVRRECFKYLKKHAALPQDEQGRAEGEALMALWMELEPDLGERVPKEILVYYRSGLGDLRINRTRKEYTEQAAFMAKVRHMFVDVLKSPQEWEAFASPIKNANVRRPAFQEEMARMVPGWKDLA